MLPGQVGISLRVLSDDGNGLSGLMDNHLLGVQTNKAAGDCEMTTCGTLPDLTPFMLSRSFHLPCMSCNIKV